MIIGKRRTGLLYGVVSPVDMHLLIYCDISTSQQVARNTLAVLMQRRSGCTII